MTIPKRIVDKNGRHTTVYVNPDKENKLSSERINRLSVSDTTEHDPTVILQEAFRKLPEGASLSILGEYGSSAHGTNVDASDYDFIGVAVEPINVVFGLEQYEHTLLGKENQNMKTPEGTDEGKVFALKKFARLISAGNTDVLSTLYLPKYAYISDVGQLLVDNRDAFVTHHATQRFAHHLMTEKRRMNGDAATKVLRPELIEQYGFDTKAAYQSSKLAFHGLRLAREQRMLIPLAEDERDFIKSIRRGELSREAIDAFLEDAIRELDSIQPSKALPETVDRERVNYILKYAYEMSYAY